MIRRFNKCCCMCNCKNSCNNENDAIETLCSDKSCPCMKDNYSDNCECGFDEQENIFPTNPMLGQSYVPIQYMDKTFTPCCGLKNGTIFPELVTTYYPGQSMMEIEYLRTNNNDGEGCKTCS